MEAARSYPHQAYAKGESVERLLPGDVKLSLGGRQGSYLHNQK